jgi:hypothetical protein
VGEEISSQQQSTVTESLKRFIGLKKNEPDRGLYVFKMNHPVNTDCELEGHCGFILKWDGYAGKWNLSREAGDYTGSLVHLHDDIRVENMYWYKMITLTTREGHQVRIPSRWWGWRWLWRWFRGYTDLDCTERFVDHYIGDYLVAKY